METVVVARRCPTLGRRAPRPRLGGVSGGSDGSRNRDEAVAVAAFERAHALAVAHDLPLGAVSALH